MFPHLLNLGLRHHIITEKGLPQKHSNPVNFCIYCGLAGGVENPLTDEHVFPDGIGGDLILDKSSCKACARKIHIFEDDAQNKYLSATRQIMQLRSRKKRGGKKIPRKGFDLYSGAASKFDDITDLERSENVLSDLADKVVMYEWFGHQRAKLLKDVHEPHSTGLQFGVALTPKNPSSDFTVTVDVLGGAYLKMCAKIAYCFAVKSLGYKNFKQCIVPLIMGEDPFLDRYMGSLIQNVEKNFLHRIAIGKKWSPPQPPERHFYIPVYVVTLQLFSNSLTPIYEIVVGYDK